METLFDTRRLDTNFPRAIGKTLFVKQGRSKKRPLTNGKSLFIKRGFNILPGAKCL